METQCLSTLLPEATRDRGRRMKVVQSGLVSMPCKGDDGLVQKLPDLFNVTVYEKRGESGAQKYHVIDITNTK